MPHYRSTITRTRRGRLPFANPGDAGHVLNLAPIWSRVEQRHDPYCNPLCWLFVEVIDNPGQRRSYFFEENGYEYEQWAVFDAEARQLRTNYGDCPRSYNHHLYEVCRVCGQDG